MKIFRLMIFVLFSCLQAGASSIEVEAKIYNHEKEGWLLEATIKNQGDKNLFVPNLDNQWIGLRLDLWCAGKGIELYSKHDSEWRREQAFVDYKWKAVGPGNTMTVKIKLPEMRSSNPSNDEISNLILEEFLFLKKGRAYLNVLYKQGDQISSVEKEIYQGVNLEIR